MPFLAPLGAAAAGAAANPITPYLLSAGAGALGNMTRKTSPGSAGSVIELPRYSWNDPVYHGAADFLAGNFARLGRGEAPAYIDRGLAASKKQMKQSLNETTYGYAGNRSYGTVNAAMQAGALAGTGARPALSGVSKALAEYSTASSNIDAEIEKMRMDATQTSVQQSIYGMGTLPQGPPTAVIGGYPAQQTEGIAPYLAQMAGNSAMLASMDKTVSSSPSAWATPYYSGSDASYQAQPGYAANVANMNGWNTPFTSKTSAAITPKSGGGFQFPSWNQMGQYAAPYLNPVQYYTQTLPKSLQQTGDWFYNNLIQPQLSFAEGVFGQKG